MLSLLAILLAATVQAQGNGTSNDINVLPLPTKYDIGSEVTCLSSDFQITVDSSASRDLHDAIGRTVEHLQSCQHQYLSIHHGSEFFPNGAECSHWVSNLALSFEGDEHKISTILDGAVQRPEDRIKWESYHLIVPTNGTATLSSVSALGLFRGLTTFETLFYYLPEQSDYNSQTMSKRWNWQGGWLYAPFGPYEIWDKPAFGWRSVLVDTSRNFFSTKSLKSVSTKLLVGVIMAENQILDGMSMVKLNVFHWHITDSQSWPLDLASYPELAKAGAYSLSRKYTEDDIKELVQYAGEVRQVSVQQMAYELISGREVSM